MCESIFDEDEDRWRVIDNCDDPECASSTTYSAAAHIIQPER
jgi:hypothetical protein